MAASTVTLTAPQVRPRTQFYFYMAFAMTAIGLVGFVPTFWLPMSRGAYTSPAITIHALACSAWLMLFLVQSWLAASGRISRHHQLRAVVSRTETWHAIAQWLLSLAR